jgi:hypothetical protein
MVYILIKHLVVDLALSRIPDAQRGAVIEIIHQSKSSPSQKRALLLKKGLLRSIADELETLADTGKLFSRPFCLALNVVFLDEDVDSLLARLEKNSPSVTGLMRPMINEMKTTIQYANSAGVTRPIIFHPLMLGNHHAHFKDGILVEVVRRNKRTDVLAAGGR